MMFPKTIRIQILKNTKPISGLVCSVELLMYDKNNYSIGFFKTDDKGEITVSKERIEFEIEEANQLFLMDYDSSTKNFKGDIEINIETSKGLKIRMNNIKEFFPESFTEIKSILKNNVNGMIDTSLSQVFQVSGNIEMDLLKTTN